MFPLTAPLASVHCSGAFAMRPRRLALMLILSGSLICALPAAAAPPDTAPAKVLTEAPPKIPGPRRTIAVGTFDMMGPAANASATNVGGPIAALMETALSECDCVTVVERDAV